MKPITSVLSAIFGVLLLTTHASGQPWPQKTVRVIVPFAAGSSTDIVPRVVFDQIAQQVGQTIVVENRAGAGGTIGAASVAKADPDGYTILASGSSHTIAPALYKSLSYDLLRDFTPVVPLGISPNVLVVQSGSHFRTVGELVAAAKAKPGSLTFSSVGVGTATHLSAERFRLSAGIDALHVPFKGGAEAMSEVIAGRVNFFFGPPALVAAHVKDGKLRALAVNGAARTAALPDVPTTREAGFANAEYPIWFGLFLPSKTPRDIVDRLHGEVAKALRSPKVMERMSALAVDTMAMSADEFARYVQGEVEMNAGLVRQVDIKPN